MFENRVILLYITLKYLSIVIILQFLQKATSKDLRAANMFAISVQKIYVECISVWCFASANRGLEIIAASGKALFLSVVDFVFTQN